MSKKFLYLFKEGHDAFGGDQTTMKNTLVVGWRPAETGPTGPHAVTDPTRAPLTRT